MPDMKSTTGLSGDNRLHLIELLNVSDQKRWGELRVGLHRIDEGARCPSKLSNDPEGKAEGKAIRETIFSMQVGIRQRGYNFHNGYTNCTFQPSPGESQTWRHSMKDVKELISRLSQNGIIGPSQSPYSFNAQILLTSHCQEEKDGHQLGTSKKGCSQGYVLLLSYRTSWQLMKLNSFAHQIVAIQLPLAVEKRSSEEIKRRRFSPSPTVSHEICDVSIFTWPLTFSIGIGWLRGICDSRDLWTLGYLWNLWYYVDCNNCNNYDNQVYYDTCYR